MGWEGIGVAISVFGIVMNFMMGLNSDEGSRVASNDCFETSIEADEQKKAA